MRMLLYISSILLVFNSFSQVRTEFGFSFNPSANTQLFTFALLTVNEKNEILAKKIIREDEFMKMIAGKQPSDANPSMVNLFEHIGFEGCELIYDEYTKRYVTYTCPPFETLWKIWFREHPVQYDQGDGWSHTRFSPSIVQLNFLHKYGIYHKGSFCYGDNMWQLLLDVLEPDWITEYLSTGTEN